MEKRRLTEKNSKQLVKTVKISEKKRVAESEKKINAPFGYFGSKNKIAIKICKQLPPHNCWVELFCGSAALTLRKKAAPIEIINDIDRNIYNLFEQLRNNYVRLCKKIEFTPYAEDELKESRFKKKNLSKLERARRFLIQSMMAINGIFGKEKGGTDHGASVPPLIAGFNKKRFTARFA